MTLNDHVIYQTHGDGRKVDVDDVSDSTRKFVQLSRYVAVPRVCALLAKFQEANGPTPTLAICRGTSRLGLYDENPYRGANAIPNALATR